MYMHICDKNTHKLIDFFWSSLLLIAFWLEILNLIDKKSFVTLLSSVGKQTSAKLNAI